MTRCAVPVKSAVGLSSEVYDHFAMSEYFAILEIRKKRIVSVDFVHYQAAGEGRNDPAEVLADAGVGVVLAGRIGSCMIRLFMGKNIKIYSGAEGTVENAFRQYVAGELTEVRPSPYQL